MFNAEINNIYFRNNSVIALYKGGSLIWRKASNSDKDNVIMGTVEDTWNDDLTVRINGTGTIIPYNSDKTFSYKITDEITTCNSMFNPSHLSKIDVSRLDTSNVSEMRYMFAYSNTEEINLTNFDTSSATYMTEMFSNCNKLISLDVSSFDTSNVTNMKNMFASCGKLTELDLSNFDTSKVNNLDQMFSYCANLEKITFGVFDINNCSTSQYILFYGCNSLTTLEGEIRGIKFDFNLRHSPLTNDSAMVIIRGLNSINNKKTLTFSQTTFDTLTDEQIAIATSKGWTVAAG